MENQLIIFHYPNMIMGGIENYITRSIVDLRGENYYIGWIKAPEARIDPVLAPIINGIQLVLDKFDSKVINSYIGKNNIKTVKVISFDIISFAEIEHKKNKIKNCKVDSFYFLPHFAMDAYFPEEAFKGIIKKQVCKVAKAVYGNAYENGSLYFFSDKHREILLEKYGLDFPQETFRIVPKEKNRLDILKYDEQHVRQRFHSEKFNILAVSRLEFPHKGFMIGALKAYLSLKDKYPQITLTIIGDGDGLSTLKKIAAQADPVAQKDIQWISTVPADELDRYYDQANLLISLAGCFTLGAEMGILALPARHYSESCEVYGFTPESIPSCLSDAEGRPVCPYIEQALEMTENEYEKRCRETFLYYQETKEITKKFSDIINKYDDSSLTALQFYEVKLIYRMISITRLGNLVRQKFTELGWKNFIKKSLEHIRK